MNETVRFTVSIDSELLSRFDEVVKEKKDENRSKAIRELARGFLWKVDGKGLRER